MSEMIFYFKEESKLPSDIRIRGRLNTHLTYDFRIAGDNISDSLVGTCTSDGWWVKGEIRNSSDDAVSISETAGADVSVEGASGPEVGRSDESLKGYFLCKSNGFTVSNTIVGREFIKEVCSFKQSE